jgi:hypothetical protein
VDVLLVPSLRDEAITIFNFTGHPALTLRAGFVEVSMARSDWAADAVKPLPTFTSPRRAPHGVTLIDRLFDEGRLANAGLALEPIFAVANERPLGFRSGPASEDFIAESERKFVWTLGVEPAWAYAAPRIYCFS